MSFRQALASTLAFAALLPVALPATPAAAAPTNDTSIIGGTGPIKDELTPAVRSAVKRGLSWLAKNQSPDGSWGSAGGGYGAGDSAGICALAGIAFLADGNMPDEGPYGKECGRVVDLVVKSTQDSGYISGSMYGHGFATLFLAEVYGMTQRQDVKEKLQMAVRLIVQCQNAQGGWRYNPAPEDADLSVTICQVMALRAAKNAGIKVPKLTIDKALDYVKKSYSSNGSFSYTLGGGGGSYALTAAGVASLQYAGVYDSTEVKGGIRHLETSPPGSSANSSGHFFYANYYATQAMFMAGGSPWEGYWPAIRKQLLSMQGPDGSWSGEAGQLYATSMALIVLQVPNRLLPILEK